MKLLRKFSSVVKDNHHVCVLSMKDVMKKDMIKDYHRGYAKGYAAGYNEAREYFLRNPQISLDLLIKSFKTDFNKKVKDL